MLAHDLAAPDLKFKLAECRVKEWISGEAIRVCDRTNLLQRAGGRESCRLLRFIQSVIFLQDLLETVVRYRLNCAPIGSHHGLTSDQRIDDRLFCRLRRGFEQGADPLV